jgi:hypothetical protein
MLPGKQNPLDGKLIHTKDLLKPRVVEW